MRLRALGSTLAVLLLPALARAGNDDGVLLGNEAAMSGGAVAATIADGSASWYNPAGLAAATRNAVDVTGSAVQLRIAEERGLITATTGEQNDGGYLELVTIPSAVTLVRRVDPAVNLALGIFAPRFTQHTTRTALDTAGTRWTLSAAENAATFHLGGGMGIRVLPNFRVGLSLFAVYRNFYDAFQTAGLTTLPGGDTQIESRGGIVEIRSLGAELGAGLQWEPIPELAIGFTARSPGLELVTQVRTTTAVLDATVGAADSVSFLPTDEETLAGGFAVLTPARFNLAVALRLTRFRIAAELDIQHPLYFEDVVSRELVWNVRVGGRYEIDEIFSAGVGFFTDRSARGPITELGQNRIDFYGLSAGLEYRMPHRLGEGEGASTIVFATTFGLRYAYGTGVVGGLLFDPAAGTTPATVEIGTSVHELGLHLGSGVYF